MEQPVCLVLLLLPSTFHPSTYCTLFVLKTHPYKHTHFIYSLSLPFSRVMQPRVPSSTAIHTKHSHCCCLLLSHHPFLNNMVIIQCVSSEERGLGRPFPKQSQVKNQLDLKLQRVLSRNEALLALRFFALHHNKSRTASDSDNNT